MLHFTALERAALEDICGQQADERGVLESQLATATVTLRENTGEGFSPISPWIETAHPLRAAGASWETSPR